MTSISRWRNFTFGPTYEYIGSEELNRLIEWDFIESASFYDDHPTFKDPLSSPIKCEVKKPALILESDEEFSDLMSTILVNPVTGLLVTMNGHSELSVPEEQQHSELSVPEEQQECPKPYHWSQDHDYMKTIKEEVVEESESKSSGLDIVEKIFKSEDEPVVEVWEIDSWQDPEADSVSQQLPSCRQAVKKETRRTSTRTAEMRQKERARKISNAVHAVFKNGKAQRTRQYRRVKPKNSVETTPSQSDIEEWYSQPVRPTYTKISKKKTSKGRIDHSESERHRREVLRTNFSSLCGLIPQKYLRGEKMSSQISKQKILNGAKAYIVAVNSAKISYKSRHHQNNLLREQWLKKCSLKLVKCVKKQK